MDLLERVFPPSKRQFSPPFLFLGPSPHHRRHGPDEGFCQSFSTSCCFSDCHFFLERTPLRKRKCPLGCQLRLLPGTPAKRPLLKFLTVARRAVQPWLFPDPSEGPFIVRECQHLPVSSPFLCLLWTSLPLPMHSTRVFWYEIPSSSDFGFQMVLTPVARLPIKLPQNPSGRLLWRSNPSRRRPSFLGCFVTSRSSS